MKRIVMIVACFVALILPIGAQAGVIPGNILFRTSFDDSLQAAVGRIVAGTWTFSSGLNVTGTLSVGNINTTGDDGTHYLDVTNTVTGTRDSTTTEGVMDYYSGSEIWRMNYGGRKVAEISHNRSWCYSIVQPDSVRAKCDTLLVQKVWSTEFPFGVQVTSVTISGNSQTLTDTLQVLELSTAGAMVDTIATLICSGKETTEGGLSYNVTAGNNIGINLSNDPDAVKQTMVVIGYQPR